MITSLHGVCEIQTTRKNANSLLSKTFVKKSNENEATIKTIYWLETIIRHRQYEELQRVCWLNYWRQNETLRILIWEVQKFGQHEDVQRVHEMKDKNNNKDKDARTKGSLNTLSQKSW